MLFFSLQMGTLFWVKKSEKKVIEMRRSELHFLDSESSSEMIEMVNSGVPNEGSGVIIEKNAPKRIYGHYLLAGGRPPR